MEYDGLYEDLESGEEVVLCDYHVERRRMDGDRLEYICEAAVETCVDCETEASM